MQKAVFSLIFFMSLFATAETKSLTDFNLQIVEISTEAYPLTGRDLEKGFSLGYINDSKYRLGGIIQCFRNSTSEQYTSYALDYSIIENGAESGVYMVRKAHLISVSEGAHEVCSEILELSETAKAGSAPSPFPQSVAVPNQVKVLIKASTAKVAY